MEQALSKILGAVSNVKILRFLSQGQRPMSGHDIAGRIGMNQSNVAKSLIELVDWNVLSRQKVGRSHLFELNSKSLFYPLLDSLFSGEREVWKSLGDHLARDCNLNLEGITLFGSYARKESDYQSDVDLLFIAAKKTPLDFEEKVLDCVYDRTGLSAGIIVYSPKELKTLMKKKNKLIQNVIKDGVSIYGKSIGEAIVGSKKIQNKKSK